MKPERVKTQNRESYTAWKGFLEDLVGRGLIEPMLTVIDGCPGLIKGVHEVFHSEDCHIIGFMKTVENKALMRIYRKDLILTVPIVYFTNRFFPTEQSRQQTERRRYHQEQISFFFRCNKRFTKQKGEGKWVKR